AVAIGILERRHLDAVDDRFLVPTLGHTSTLGAASATSDAAPGFDPSSGRQQRAARSDISWPCEEYSPRHSSSRPLLPSSRIRRAPELRPLPPPGNGRASAHNVCKMPPSGKPRAMDIDC